MDNNIRYDDAAANLVAFETRWRATGWIEPNADSLPTNP
jgi:hypothetical protein